MMIVLSKWSIEIIKVIDYRYLSWGALFLICALVFGLTGPMGFFVMLVASAIGWIPVLFNSRRSNCMGILLFPIAMYMSGYGPFIWRLMGLD
jgi:putative membrane protein